MVVVPKTGQNKVRICTDYTELNKHILREFHPMATVDSSFAQLGQGQIFSKIDANSEFLQILLSRESSKLTTFLTRSGRYRYLRLPQGLCSAPEIFVAEMTNINFLGYVIDQSGIHVGPPVQGIVDFPTPENVTSVRSFFGMANEYAKFSEELAAVSEPIKMLLKKDVPWHWSSKQENSFKRTKEIFQNAPVLAIYDVDKGTIIATDASNAGLRATLCQIQQDWPGRCQLLPLAVFAEAGSTP